MGTIINQVSVLFLIMSVGFIIKKIKMIDRENVKKLSEILINVTLPCMIIISFQTKFSTTMLNNAKIIFIVSFLIHVISVVLGYLLYKNSKRKNVLIFSTIFSNCAYMGYPILDSLYKNNNGVFYGAMYVICFNIFAYSLGVKLYASKEEKVTYKKMFINPGIISILIGFTFYITSIKLPMAIFRSIESIGEMTTPLSMIIIGSLIAEANFNNSIIKFETFLSIALRIIVFPLIVFVIFKFIGVDGIVRNICVLCTGMPIATLTAIFAEKYNDDSYYASMLVVISTLLSMITLPFLIYLTSIL